MQKPEIEGNAVDKSVRTILVDKLDSFKVLKYTNMNVKLFFADFFTGLENPQTCFLCISNTKD